MGDTTCSTSQPPARVGLPGVGQQLHEALFESLDQGVCLIERSPHRPDGRRDYRYLAMNPAMRAMFGIDDLTGQSVRDNFPDEVEDWYDDYDRVVDTGEPIRFVRESEPQGKVLEMFLTRVEDGSGLRLLAVMQDVTERERAEERRRFLLALNDALRPLTSADAVQGAATLTLGEHLEASRVHYAELVDEGATAVVSRDYARGVPTVTGRHRMAEFAAAGAEFRAGRTFVVDDVETDASLDDGERQAFLALGVRAIVVVPLVKEEVLVALLAVHLDRPRSWSPHAIALVEETAERTWAAVERARAESELRVREEQLQLALEAAGAGSWCLWPETGAFTASDLAVQLHGLAPGAALDHQTALARVHPHDRADVELAVARTVEWGEPLRCEHRVIDASGTVRWVASFAERRRYGGELRVVGLVQDITVRKLAEEALRADEAAERAVALSLQRALLPGRLPAHPQVELAARYAAGTQRLEVGGDWYDAFELGDGRMALTVGDVVGSGLEAAAAMGQLRTAIAAVASDRSPAAVLTELDAFVARTAVTDFATVCYAVYDPKTGRLGYASAGHPPMLAVSADGRVRRLEGGRSTPLMRGGGGPRREASAVLEPGTVLLAYSDGLIERRGEHLDRGLERLEQATAEAAGRPAEAVCAHVLAAFGVDGEATADDVVVLAARVTSTHPPAQREGLPV